MYNDVDMITTSTSPSKAIAHLASHLGMSPPPALRPFARITNQWQLARHRNIPSFTLFRQLPLSSSEALYCSR
jgi:hypothetical protein